MLIEKIKSSASLSRLNYKSIVFIAITACLFMFWPLMAVIFVCYLLVLVNVFNSEDELNSYGFIGLVSIAIIFNAISLPYETMINGELGVAYLDIIKRSSLFDIYLTSGQKIIPFYFIKSSNFIMSYFLNIDNDVVLSAVLVRMFVGVSSALIFYGIHRKITYGLKYSVALSLLATVLVVTHHHTWLYLHGDQFRNAFGNMLLLLSIYSGFLIKDKIKSFCLILTAMVGAFICHRLYAFLVPMLILSVIIYEIMFSKLFSYKPVKKWLFNSNVIDAKAVLFLVLSGMIVFGCGIEIISNMSNWKHEVLFTGHSMDMKYFSSTSYLKRLMVPAEIYMWSTFVFIICTRKFVYKIHGLDYKKYSVILIFYIYIFVLSHTWMYSREVDLSRLFTLITPAAVILLVIHVYSTISVVCKNEKIILLTVSFFTLCVSLISIGKVVWETSWNKELSRPLGDALFSNSQADLGRYIFGIENNSSLHFPILIFIIILSVLFLLICYKNKARISKETIVAVFLIVVVVPGIYLSIKYEFEMNNEIKILKEKFKHGNTVSGRDVLTILNKRKNYVDKEVIAWNEVLASKGDVDAQLTLGIYMSSRLKSKSFNFKNNDLALAWLLKASKYDNSALYYLANHLELEDVDRAIELYVKSSQSGNAAARIKLGCAYYFGKLERDINIEKATLWFCPSNLSVGSNLDKLCSNYNIYNRFELSMLNKLCDR